LLGVIGGLMGALFIEINMFMARMRKRFLGKSKPKKVIEAIVFSAVGATLVFFAPMMFDCVDPPETLKIGISYNCHENQINPMATLLWNTQGNTIRYFFN
jgi:chloride channel 7